MLPTRCRTVCTAWLAIAVLQVGLARAQTTGLIPINDLGMGNYLGFQGGLYSGGQNAPPDAHLDAALARAAEIVPRDAAGAPDANGWIAMIAVGMSNTTHEFGAFERNADADSTRNARVVLLDTGFGGQAASIIANPNAGYWTTMSQRIAAMGLTPAQVQVAWLKEAEANPPNNFPLHAQAFRDTLKHVVQNLHAKFPNLKIVYVSTRIYGGYSAQGGLNPEPQAYEYGFSVKWLIEDQIAGDPALNYGQLGGDVRAPLLLWGPYLWADGTNPRSDGLTWQLVDLESDHVHPAPSGEQKVAGLLTAFFAAETTARGWWPAQPGVRLVTLDAIHDATVSAATPAANFGADPQLVSVGGVAPKNAYLRFDASAVAHPLLLAKLSLRVIGTGGGTVRRVQDATWNESTITYANAPPIGASLVTLPQSSRDGTIGANVTGTLLADADGQVSFALTNAATGQADYHSQEAGQPPRLVLVTSSSPAGVGDRSTVVDLALRVSPNPASGDARILFELPVARSVELAIYSLDGRRVRTLANGAWSAGLHSLSWDRRDAIGRRTAPGLYFVRMSSGGQTQSAKVVSVR